MGDFALDLRLDADTFPVATLGLCELRLMNDARWPWLILVPRRAGIVEIFDLKPLDQVILTFETELVARALKRETDADKINVAALGNSVPMFHQHVVARRTGDANWPGPVWGHGKAEPYDPAEAGRFARSIETAVLSD